VLAQLKEAMAAHHRESEARIDQLIAARQHELRLLQANSPESRFSGAFQAL
jgi:hypothetical protein